jgi:hypothetical protein
MTLFHVEQPNISGKPFAVCSTWNKKLLDIRVTPMRNRKVAGP